jgi:hypothetical protein
MSNDKRKQAKKKQRERDIQQRKNSEQQQKFAEKRQALRQAKLDEYPTIRIGEKDADPEFIKAVEEAVKKIDFLDERELGEGYLSFLRCGKEYGFSYAFQLLNSLPVVIDPREGIATTRSKMAFVCLRYGECLFSKIPKEVLKRYLPYNDVDVYFQGSDIVLSFSSIRSQVGPHGTIYYNPVEPKIQFDGKEFKVGFSHHAIERICQRLNPDYLSYIKVADIYAYFRTCVYFEPIRLHNDQLGFVLYNMCFNPDTLQNEIYAKDIFGLENEVPGMGKLYYKVGYCAVVIEGEFAKAKTFLPPGYRSTPEYGLLLKSNLPRVIKDNWIEKATDESWTEIQNIQSHDTEIIKWFHQNGIPQVKQIKETVFIDKIPPKPSR